MYKLAQSERNKKQWTKWKILKSNGRQGDKMLTSLSVSLCNRKSRDRESTQCPCLSQLCAKDKEPVFPGIIGFLDQQWCYDKTVIEFVIQGLKHRGALSLLLSLLFCPQQSQLNLSFLIETVKRKSQIVHVSLGEKGKQYKEQTYKLLQSVYKIQYGGYSNIA